MITVKKLQEMNKIDFAKIIRGIKKDEIREILIKYKINVEKTLKVNDMLDILFKCVNGEIDPINDFKNVYDRINLELSDFYSKYKYSKILIRILECENTKSLKRIEKTLKDDFNKINSEAIPKFRSKKKETKLRHEIDDLNSYVKEFVYPEIEKQKFQLHIMKRKSGELQFNRFDEDLFS